MPTATPTPRQLEYQDWEFGVFIHFGIRTFYEGHRDWDGQPMSPEAFRPDQLDCNQWAETAAKAGAKYMVMTAKHHDGFANWPSRCTDFSVANSPWMDGGGDVVAQFIDACRSNGIRPGLYYSPAEWGNPSYEDPTSYDDYFINQISEILLPYGKIDILWFDGCGSGDHSYDWQRICREIRRMQPGILIFSMGDPDFRWVGNELGLAPSPSWNTVEKIPVAVDSEADAETARPVWLPAECDCRMRFRNWFYSDQDEDTVKSLDELMGIYYYSVGRGCNLLLNIGPDRRGLLPDKDTARLLEFGREVERRFSAPLATIEDARRDGNAWHFDLSPGTLVDHVIAQETLDNGEHINAFSIDINPNHKGQWINVWQGNGMGHKAICHFPAAACTKVRVHIHDCIGEPQIRSLQLHYSG